MEVGGTVWGIGDFRGNRSCGSETALVGCRESLCSVGDGHRIGDTTSGYAVVQLRNRIGVSVVGLYSCGTVVRFAEIDSGIVGVVGIAGVGTDVRCRIVVPGLCGSLTRGGGMGIRIGDGTSADISNTGEVRSFDESGVTLNGFGIVGELSVGTSGSEGSGTVGDGFGECERCCVGKRSDGVSGMGGFTTIEIGRDIRSSGGGVSGDDTFHDHDMGRYGRVHLHTGYSGETCEN